MKSNNFFLGITLAALGLTSCKNEKEIQAEKTINAYAVYTDSLGSIDSKDAKTNWEAINSGYQKKEAAADEALNDLKNAKASNDKLQTGKQKFATLKANVEAQIATDSKPSVAPDPKQHLRNSLFGEGKVGEDMKFDWVTAANIHEVYQLFVHTAENNKDKYTREDWDEVKLMYEALDSRKNTVEKEGLTSKDNLKIAGLKIKFATMYRINRMGAKSEEMEKAKK